MIKLGLLETLAAAQSWLRLTGKKKLKELKNEFRFRFGPESGFRFRKNIAIRKGLYTTKYIKNNFIIPVKLAV